MSHLVGIIWVLFYDNLILSGTKIRRKGLQNRRMFYDNLILSGTKILVGKA